MRSSSRDRVDRRAIVVGALGGSVSLVGCARARRQEERRSSEAEVDAECARIEGVLGGLDGVISVSVRPLGYQDVSLEPFGVALDFRIENFDQADHLLKKAVRELWLSTIQPGPRVTAAFRVTGLAMKRYNVPLGRLTGNEAGIPPGLTQAELLEKYGPRPS